MIRNPKIGIEVNRYVYNFFSLIVKNDIDVFSSMTDKRHQFSSNQRLFRSQPKSPNLNTNALNSTIECSSRFLLDSQDPVTNLMPTNSYLLVNQDSVNYSADSFVYSQFSNLNYRPEISSSYHTIRMSPYARQTRYPAYMQREIHSPSSSYHT